MTQYESVLGDPRVGVARLASADYEGGGIAVGEALDRLARWLGWVGPGRGPFGAIVPEGATVLVKPNWVSHANQGAGGFEPLVTHGSVVRTVTEALLLSRAGRVKVGDAPLQACDFEALQHASGLVEWTERLRQRDARFEGVFDFRRTRSVVRDGIRTAFEDQRPMERFVLFDLGHDSLLEPITADGSFRVTQYDPRLLQRTHAPGRHQYLVAREVIEANVIVNLPKLKTHKKAGVTCALKNLIGINGNKEYLPHHRIGGSGAGGDCYAGTSRVKRALEIVLDQQNTTASSLVAQGWNQVVRVLNRVALAQGEGLDVEGSWSGNDTIWRTCLDLNRILLYGKPDGTLADTPQRRVVHVVDAVVAGQGNGPLSPEPLPLGLLLGANNAAAMDWVGAQLLGYDPARIPIAREAFGRFAWPLTTFQAGTVEVVGDLAEGRARTLAGVDAALVRHPVGWMDAVNEATGR